MSYSRREFFTCGIFDALLANLERPLEAQPPRPLRIDAQRCFSAMGCPCDVCVERCPLDPRPISVETGEAPEVAWDGCDGCGVCAWYCPADALEA